MNFIRTEMEDIIVIDWILANEELRLSSKGKIQPTFLKSNDLCEYGIKYYE